MSSGTAKDSKSSAAVAGSKVAVKVGQQNTVAQPATVGSSGMSSTPTTLTSASKMHTDDILADETPNYIPPPWNEQEIASEKWSTKGPFEDPDGLQRINRWLDVTNPEYKRIGEIQLSTEAQQQHAPIVTLPTNYQSEFFLSATLSQQSGRINGALSQSGSSGNISSMWGFSDFVSKDSVWSKYYSVNQKILTKSWARHMIASWHLMYYRNMVMPWEMIYPKGRDGLPSYNPSGKYFVKLFWFGTWRKIVIDDRIPVDAQGSPLLPLSPGDNEIWPLLIGKALLKILSINDRNGSFAISSFLHAMTAWLPEALSLDEASNFMQNEIFAPLNSDNFRIAIPADNYLDSIPLLIEKPLKENGKDVLYAAPQRRNETNNDNESTDQSVRVRVDATRIAYIVYLRDPGPFKSSLKYQTSLKEPGKSDASYSSNTYLIERDDYGSNEDYLIIIINHGGVFSRSEVNNCSILEISECNGKINGIKELISLQAYDSVNTIKVRINPEERLYRLSVNRLNNFTLHIMALNSGLTLKEECSCTEHIRLAVLDREEALPAYNAKSWNVLFKTNIRVIGPQICTFQLYIPNLLWGCTKMKLVDNDSQKIISDSPLEIRKCPLVLNCNGYTLLAESRPFMNILPSKMKLRISGSNPLPAVGAEFSSKAIPQEFEGNYVFNKQKTLFRNFISWQGPEADYLSIHLKLSDKEIEVRLRLTLDEKEILSVDGKGAVTIPSVFLSALAEGSKSKYLLHAYLLSDDSNIACALEGQRPTEMQQQNISPTQRPITPSRSKTPSYAYGGAAPKKKRTENAKDTAQDERYRSIKQGWEASQPGRSTKARDSRDAFLKAQVSTSTRNSDMNLSVPDAEMVNYTEWRVKKTEGFREFQKAMDERFGSGLSSAKDSRVYQMNAFQQVMQENVDIARKLNDERGSYRKFLKDITDVGLVPTVATNANGRQTAPIIEQQPASLVVDQKQQDEEALNAAPSAVDSKKKKPKK